MTYTFFNHKFDNGVNKVFSKFDNYPMGSFQVTCISQNMFCNLAKITHLGDLETDHFNLELAIELYS